MRHYILLVTFVFGGLVAFAQNVTRPVLHTGDTIYLARDLLPHPIDFFDTGDDLYWDMSRLLSPFVHMSLTRPDGGGGFILTGADDVDRYLSEMADGLYITKLLLPDVGTGTRTVVDIDPPVPYVKNAALYDTWTYAGTISMTAPKGGRKIKLVLTIRAETDASGELFSPTYRYDVLRERRDIEVFASPENPTVNPGELGLPMGFFSGRLYVFQSAVSAVPVAVVQTDAMNQAKQAEYLTQSWAGAVVQQIPRRPDIFVYPNPSFGNVRFDFLNLAPGYYDLEVYNILGTKLRTEHIFVNGMKTLPLDLTRLKKGTYIYRLVDSQKNTIRSKRLVIITP